MGSLFGAWVSYGEVINLNYIQNLFFIKELKDF